MKKILLILFGILLFFLCVLPFLYLGNNLLFQGGKIDFELFQDLFTQASTLGSLKNSLIICTLTSILSALIAIPLAWIMARTNLSFKSFWKTLFSLPYAIPPFVGAIAWINLANPSNGILTYYFSAINIYSLSGLVFVMSSFFYTTIFLNLLHTLEKINPSMEEAARISGANQIQVFYYITLPLIIPALLSGMLLTFLSTLANFGIASLIGSPAEINMVTTQIYTLLKMGSTKGFKLSGALSVILLLITGIIFFADYHFSKKFRFGLVGGKSEKPSLVQLGKWNIFVQLILVAGSLVLFILPILSILFASLSRIQGNRTLENLGWQNYKTIFFETDETYRAFGNSFFLAIITAIVCTIIGFLLAQSRKSISSKIYKLKEIFLLIPYAAPGTVLALSITLTTLAFKLPIYNTLGIILIAYLAKFAHFSYRSINEGILQIDDCLIEAAKIAGANSWQRFFHIWLPLLMPVIIASLFLVFMPALSELTMSVLLSGPGNETIGTLIFQLQEYGDASGGGSSVLSFCILVLIIICNFILKLVTKGKYGL